MAKNPFAERLQQLLALSGVKNAALAKCVQYDLSYISKWLSGKMLPSEKNFGKVVADIAACLGESGNAQLCELYSCKVEMLNEAIAKDLLAAYDECRPQKNEISFSEVQSINEVVDALDAALWKEGKAISVVDILSLPHESRLILAGIRNGRFVPKPKSMEYNMVIQANFGDNVYDSIFLIHMLTSMSDIRFKLYNSPNAAGKLICATKNFMASAMIFPGQKDCTAVNVRTGACGILQNLDTLIDQENAIFRESTIAEMLECRDYIQTMISTNIRWILGHITEQLLPKDVYDELAAADDGDTSEYGRLWNLSHSIVCAPSSRIMLYESAIANLAVDGVVDFFNRPVSLSASQVLRCLRYLKDLILLESRIRLIDGGFSEDFRYITNPCMFLSDSLCYLRLENNRYEDNILILKDRAVKEMFEGFFDTVWEKRRDVVTEDPKQILNKIDHYIASASILIGYENENLR